MFKRTAFIGLTLLCISSTVTGGSLLVEVFHGAEQRVINIKDAERVATVAVYDLSEPEQIEDRISAHLSNDPLLAQRQAKRILEANGQNIMREFAAAYQGNLKAKEYQLTKLPAIVFNHGQSVVYGELNLAKAIYRYRESLARSKK